MTPYERLEAWRACHRLALATYEHTGTFPRHEQYGLTSQIRRAAVSVCANIAEGSAKRGPAEFRRFLNIALGSMAELTYLLRLAKDLKLLTPGTFAELEGLRRPAGFLLWRLYRSLAPPK